MTSKIINMAEHMKDAQDRMLESMFESAPIADNGFSAQVMRRVRRRMALRMLSLPIAVLIGGVIAFKPFSAILGIAYQLLLQMPDEIVAGAVASLPTVQLLVTGGLVLCAAVFTMSMLED